MSRHREVEFSAFPPQIVFLLNETLNSESSANKMHQKVEFVIQRFITVCKEWLSETRNKFENNIFSGWYLVNLMFF